MQPEKCPECDGTGTVKVCATCGEPQGWCRAATLDCVAAGNWVEDAFAKRECFACHGTGQK